MRRAFVPVLLTAIAIPLVGAAASLAHHPVVTIAIDATANVHAINPQIYGVAFASKDDLIALNAPLNRKFENNRMLSSQCQRFWCTCRRGDQLELT